MRLDPGATSFDLAQDVFGLLFTARLEATFLVERRERRVVAANPACVELLGVPVDDLVGASVTALLDTDDSDGRDASIFDHAGHYEDVALRQPDAPPRWK